MAGASGESIAAVLDRLSADLSRLARSEVELAKAEMAQKARAAALGLAVAAVAASLAAAGAVLLVVTLVLGLATAMSAWLACALVGLGALIGATLLTAVAAGILRRVSPLPERTIAEIREDMRWLGQRLREGS
jgi:Putative Actinobacterial Holin-X, holin superfamily III